MGEVCGGREGGVVPIERNRKWQRGVGWRRAAKRQAGWRYR